MKKIVILITSLFIIAQTLLSQNIDKKSVTGSWIGRISAGAVTLRVVFNLSLVENDSLTATLDSPDQGAKNIKLGKVSLTGEALKISAGAMFAEYNGTVKNDTLIEGTWTQAGKPTSLNLTRLKKAFTLNRPQEPKPPYPYKTEDVTFVNEKSNIKLAGTITIPQGNGSFPAVILISGSGAQNRDEELMGHKPFFVIADYLARNGIAVLRYDDRGVGRSQGIYKLATSADLATDAEAAFNYLMTYTLIDHNKTGLAGHSEGGLIASMVASSNNNVSFVISLAGTGVTGEKILYRQTSDLSRISGISEKKIKENNAINKKLYQVVMNEPDNKKAEEKVKEVYRKILADKKTPPEDIEKGINQLMASFNASSYTWFRYFLTANPATFWKKVKCPVLALDGTNDLQVAADVNIPAISKALKSGGNKSVKTVALPGLNHLFQHCKTGLPTEYGEIEETFSPEALKIINDWIIGLQAAPQAF